MRRIECLAVKPLLITHDDGTTTDVAVGDIVTIPVIHPHLQRALDEGALLEGDPLDGDD